MFGEVQKLRARNELFAQGVTKKEPIAGLKIEHIYP